MPEPIVTATVTDGRTDASPDMRGMPQHWTLTLRQGRRSARFGFSAGSAWQPEEGVTLEAEILSAVLSDAAMVYRDGYDLPEVHVIAQDLVDEFGEEDSAGQVLATARALHKGAGDLRRVLGDAWALLDTMLLGDDDYRAETAAWLLGQGERPTADES